MESYDLSQNHWKNSSSISLVGPGCQHIFVFFCLIKLYGLVLNTTTTFTLLGHARGLGWSISSSSSRTLFLVSTVCSNCSINSISSTNNSISISISRKKMCQVAWRFLCVTMWSGEKSRNEPNSASWHWFYFFGLRGHCKEGRRENAQTWTKMPLIFVLR